MSTDQDIKTEDKPAETKPELVRREATVSDLAQIVADSRDFPDARHPAKAAVRILAGRECGIGPIASVMGIRIQAGRVSMDAALMAGVIDRSTVYRYDILQIDNDGCKIAFWKADKQAGESSFTAADAKQAGLAGKDTWRGYPRNMMFARALANGARWYCPGLFNGAVYTHEELGYEVDAEGRAVGGGDDAATGGADLCTREQRQQIAQLVEAAGKSMPGFLAELGIQLLDQLSSYEADKEVKKLQKAIDKAGKVATATQTAATATKTEEPKKDAKTLSPAQQTLADGYQETAQPSTPQQRQQIIDLAERLEPNEADCREMIMTILGKRHCKRLADLNHLQAAAIIDGMEARLAEPPFDPNPNPSQPQTAS